MGPPDAGALKRYPLYLFARSGALWLPVFFIWFLQILDQDLSAALQVSSVYWIAVVVLEVPSGYIADRLGRRGTLVAAAVFGVTANVAYATADNAAGLIAGQILLAACSAFQSGADTAWLYDTLASVGRRSEHAQHEARASSWGFAGYALSAVAGGLLGAWSLPAVYWISSLCQLWALLLAASLPEPPAKRTTERFVAQVVTCLRLAARPVLGWSIGIAVAGMVFSHIPLEFLQPYWKLVSDGGARFDSAPVIGALISGTMLLAAFASRGVPALLRRVTAPAVLLGTVALQVGLVGWYGLGLHWLIGVGFLVRSLALAWQQPVVRAMAHDRIASEQRATFISMIALAGNLAFGVYLWSVGVVLGGGTTTTWKVLQPVLGWSAVLGGAVLAGLAWSWVFVQRRERTVRAAAATVRA